jgi:UDPglucose 6-dehydrogenase
MKVTVFGTDYVGLMQAACLAEVGHSVCGINVDAQRIELLNSGHSLIFEPGIGRGRTMQA